MLMYAQHTVAAHRQRYMCVCIQGCLNNRARIAKENTQGRTACVQSKKICINIRNISKLYVWSKASLVTNLALKPQHISHTVMMEGREGSCLFL